MPAATPMLSSSPSHPDAASHSTSKTDKGAGHGPSALPTADKPESKRWFHDGSLVGL